MRRVVRRVASLRVLNTVQETNESTAEVAKLAQLISDLAKKYGKEKEEY